MISRPFRLALSLSFVLSLGIAATAQEAKENSAEKPESSVSATKKRAASKTSTAAKKASAKSKTAVDPSKLEKATFGGGCFWCLEAIFERVTGVTNVVSGYAGGTTKKPYYDLVCTGTTGHAEVVQITYDPEVVTFEQLLDMFWRAHDPTTLNRQGEDFGTQYRSIILYHNEAQQKAALKSYEELTSAGAFGSPIVTQLVPLQVFYPAEKHHQDYYRKNRNAAYCQRTIAPKLMHLKQEQLQRDAQQRQAQPKP